MHTKRLFAAVTVAAALLACAGSAIADGAGFTIAADSSSHTYHKMLGELVAKCPEINIQEANVSGGATGNLQALHDNKVQAAFMHSDVFSFNRNGDDSYGKFQTLAALWSEPIHVLALRQSRTSVNGAMGLVGRTQEFHSLSDLAGYKVGAAGGGFITARILKGTGEGNFEVVPFNSGGDVIKALNNGEIGAAIFVGAAPLPNLEALDKTKYKLLPIGDSIANHVQGIYRPAKITYPGLTNGPLRTLAPMATLLSRKFNTPARTDTQRKFRTCLKTHLAELQDDGAPNWQEVKPDDKGVLGNWLDLSN